MSKLNLAPADETKKQKYARTKAIALETLKLEYDEVYYIKILEAVVTKQTKEKNAKGEIEEKDIDIAKVLNLDTGEVNFMVVPSVLMSLLNENYNGETYVNKSFELEKMRKRGDKRYHTFKLYEVDSE